MRSYKLAEFFSFAECFFVQNTPRFQYDAFPLAFVSFCIRGCTGSSVNLRPGEITTLKPGSKESDFLIIPMIENFLRDQK